MSLEFHEYSRIFERPIPASFFKLIQAVEIPWIFKNIQAHKSWKFLEIPSSIFLQEKITSPKTFFLIIYSWNLALNRGAYFCLCSSGGVGGGEMKFVAVCGVGKAVRSILVVGR